MYLQYSKIMSIILVLAYIYIKTKSKPVLAGAMVGLHIIVVSYYFDKIYEIIPMSSAGMRVLLICLIILVPIGAFLGYVAYATKKYRDIAKEKLTPNFYALLSFSKSNILFFVIMVLLNLLALMLDRN